MPTSGYLSQSLRRPLPTKDDGILRTVADAAGYMMALSKDRTEMVAPEVADSLPEEVPMQDLPSDIIREIRWFAAINS